MPKTEITCGYCKKKVHKYTYKSHQPRYCSHECASKADVIPRRHPKVNCEVCGQPFQRYVPPSSPTPRFCSKECQHKGNRPRLRYVWDDAKDDLIRDAYHRYPTTEALNVLQTHRAFRGWPRHTLRKRAQKLGIARLRPAQPKWCDEELGILRDMVGNHHVERIQRALKRAGYQRSLTAIAVKCKQLHLSVRYQGTLCARDLAEAFGVDHHLVDHWIQVGMLKTRQEKRGTRHEITENTVRKFIRSYPLEVSRTRVDIVWLIGMLS